MRPFGFIRLYREDVGFLHRLYYRLAGVAVDNKLHFLYLTRFVRKHVDRPLAGPILDAGCEYGDYSFYFADRYPGCEVLGIDIVGQCIDQNDRLLPRTGLDNLRFEQADICEIECRDRFGFICCIDVLEHIPDQTRAIENLHRALQDGGSLFVHIPLARRRPVVFDRYLTEFHEWAEHEHIAEEHTRDSIEALFEECGFRVVASESTFHHYLGELAVSILMLFYGNTAFNRAVLALLTPLLWVLVRLDVAIPFENGNAVALLLQKE
ncbi:MAG: class I SAM-dependent methyltransferase [Gemmatimonadota bacterium]|jgi:trans-aconitate methyltransferase